MRTPLKFQYLEISSEVLNLAPLNFSCFEKLLLSFNPSLEDIGDDDDLVFASTFESTKMYPAKVLDIEN